MGKSRESSIRNWLVTILVFVVVIIIFATASNLFSNHYKDAGDIAIDRGIMYDIDDLFDSLENSHFDYVFGYSDAPEAFHVLENYIAGDADTTKEDAEDAILMLSHYLDAEKEAVKLIRQGLNFNEPGPSK